MSTLRWQAAPISAAAMILGWTSSFRTEADAILLVIGFIFVLFSTMVLAESYFPDNDNGEVDNKSRFNKWQLILELFGIQGIISLVLGIFGAYIFEYLGVICLFIIFIILLVLLYSILKNKFL